jgi:hypothetical protein
MSSPGEIFSNGYDLIPRNVSFHLCRAERLGKSYSDARWTQRMRLQSFETFGKPFWNKHFPNIN